MYHQLKDVYSPLLAVPAAEGGHGLEPRLGELLAQVQAGLGSAVRRAGTDTALKATSPGGGPDNSPLRDIVTPLDEIQFWAELATDAGSSTARAAAQQISQALEPLRQPFEALGQGQLPGSWEGVRELAEQAANALRAAWVVRLPGPGGSGAGFALGQARADNFLKTIGAALTAYVQSQLTRNLDLWSGLFADVRSALTGASGMLAAWATHATDVTEDWRLGLEGDGHQWSGPAYSDQAMAALRERLEEVSRSSFECNLRRCYQLQLLVSKINKTACGSTCRSSPALYR